MADDGGPIDPAALAQFKMFVAAIHEERSSAKGLVRLDEAEMKALSLLLRGDTDRPGMTVRAAAYDKAIKELKEQLNGPPGKSHDGLEARVKDNGRMISAWVKVQWAVLGGVLALLAKWGADSLGGG